MKYRNTKHHIIPRSRGGGNEDSNIKRVAENRHEAFHLLFKNALPEEAVLIIIRKWWYKDTDVARDKLLALIDILFNMVDKMVEK